MSTGTYISSSFLYINLGCHMMFVLKNRLKAQAILEDKTSKIINDLVSAIFKENIIKTLLIPQEPLTISSFKQLFRKLAHSSIMKLDQPSMDKLLYLMLMTVKKEVFMTSSPLQMYGLTLGNMKILKQYAQGTPSESLLQIDINHFTSTALSYSFIQYLELKEFLLTLLESYQTKVINFVELGHQNQLGKLTFIRRNHHNQQPLGTATNHSKLTLALPPFKSTFMSLDSWKNWTPSLVMDHAAEYEKQTERRKVQSDMNWIGKQKNLNQLFGMNDDNLNDFEVRLDLFDYGETQKKVREETSGTSGKQQKVNLLKKQEKIGVVGSQIKGKIEKQFESLKISQEEEVDLLEMMDT